MDKKMTSGEIAKKVGVSQKTIRLYDEKGLLKPSEYSEGNYRLYDKEALLILENIIALKQIGFSLEEIRDNLINDSELNIVDSLNAQLKIMEEKKLEIERVIECIKGMLARTEGQPDWNTVAEIAKMIQKDQGADERHFYALKYTAEDKDWYERLFEYLDINEDSNVLDLGCGFAKLWRNNWDRIPEGVKIDAVDVKGSWADNFAEFVPENIDTLSKGTTVNIHWGNIEEGEIWEKADVYQYVIAHYLLDFIEDKESLLNNVVEHLAADGMFSCNYAEVKKEHFYWANMLEKAGVDTKFIKDVIDKKQAKHQEFVKLLEKYFGTIKSVKFSNSMRFDNIDEAFEKLCKSYPNNQKTIDENKIRIMDMLAKEIEENGVIVVENDSEFFACRK